MPGAEAGDPGREGAVHVSVLCLGWEWVQVACGGRVGWVDTRTEGDEKHKVDIIAWKLDLPLALEGPGSCLITKAKFARSPLLTGCESPQLSYQPPLLSLQGSCWVEI